MSTGFRTSRAAWLALAASLVVGLAFGAAGAGARSGHSLSGITVFAGSSMTDVLPGIDAGNTYSFGSSNTLANQISNGAPADVFMSANTTTPAALYAAGKVEKWEFEGVSPTALRRQGIKVKEEIKPGETYTFTFAPTWDGSKGGLLVAMDIRGRHVIYVKI